jgi:enterochelin esterase-like enzyme
MMATVTCASLRFYVHDGGEYLERAPPFTITDNLIHTGTIPLVLAVMIDAVNRMNEYWANDKYRKFHALTSSR